MKDVGVPAPGPTGKVPGAACVIGTEKNWGVAVSIGAYPCGQAPIVEPGAALNGKGGIDGIPAPEGPATIVTCPDDAATHWPWAIPWY